MFKQFTLLIILAVASSGAHADVNNGPLFSQMLKFIDYSPDRYKKVWNKMYFRRALFIPKKVGTDKEVIDWVGANGTGVGYVSEFPQNNPNVEICGK